MVQILPGHIEAQQTVAVEMAKPGAIESFLADVGQPVTEGQVLARLVTSASPDSALPPAQARLAALKSASDQAKLEAAKDKADAQRAKDEAARAAKRFEREQRLMDAGATPRKTFEQAQREAEAASAEAEKLAELSRLAENRTYAIADQMRDAAAAVEAAARQDADSRASLAAAEIHAPATGIVVERKGQIGQTSGEVFRIGTDLSRLRAVFALTPGIHQGQELLITVQGVNAAPIHAVVSALDAGTATADFQSLNAAIVPGAPCTVSVQP